jgi:peptidoglycan/LPS O-acetylase OafA/YrhL
MKALPAPRDASLDIARSIAILLVLLAHYGGMLIAAPPRWLLMLETHCALAGVDLFFVLSGLLIGRLLFAVADQGPSFRAWRIFMTRRWLRTLPLYWLWLPVLLLVLPVPPHAARLVLVYATLTQNLAWPMPPGQWFAVSWSLVVEEWFYLLFSAAFLALAALVGGRRAAWPVILLFLVVPAVCRQTLPPGRDYLFGVVQVAALRLDAIAYGVALAALLRAGWFARRRWAWALLGLALPGVFWVQDIGGVWFGLPLGPTAYLNAARIATSLGFALLLAAAIERSGIWPPLRRAAAFGASLSYGLYIMHMTVLQAVLTSAAAHGIGRPVAAALSLTLTLLLAAASWRWYESPILRRRPAQAEVASARRNYAAAACVGSPTTMPARSTSAS